MMSEASYDILIADDESLARDSIKILLEKRPSCNIIGECENGKEALELIKARKPQIVFLDIQMPGIQGLEVIESLDERDAPIFIMVTAFDQYALRAFELNAIDYLLKPYSDSRFFKSLDKAIEQVDTGKSHEELEVLKKLVDHLKERKPVNEGKLVVKSSGKIQLVNKENILYVKAAGNYCEIHTSDKKHLMYGAISEMEKQLSSHFFVRIHRSTIVNKESIRELESHFNGEYIVHLENGDQLKLSRSYRDNLDALLTG